MIQNNIGCFSRYVKKPNDIKYGFLYTTEIDFNCNNDEIRRTIRVWLPEDYFHSNKRYPVMYMADGQNMVDKYTTAYGAWNLDERMHELSLEGYQEMILVGVDCPKDPLTRISELCPPVMPDSKNKEVGNAIPLGNLFGDILFNRIKPLVDSLFRTLPDKANTGVGGSSMGGIMAFYLGMKYRDLVSFSLCFSPAFLLYKQKTIRSWFLNNKVYSDKCGRFYFYCGGKDKYEQDFFKTTNLVFSILKRRGFDKQICFVYDSRNAHNEASWSSYVVDALKYLYYERKIIC